jgi:hypothetical protein
MSNLTTNVTNSARRSVSLEFDQSVGKGSLSDSASSPVRACFERNYEKRRFLVQSDRAREPSIVG